MKHARTPVMLDRRRATALLLATAAGSVIAQPAWPDKAVRIIVPTAAGSGSDLIARVIAQRLAEAWKQPVLVDNRAGASGVLGVDAVVKAAPDGHTLLMTSASPVVINPLVMRKLPHDPRTQLVPVSHVGIAQAALLIHGELPARNLQEFVALARSRPRQLSYGSFGVGTGGHLGVEAFNQAAGIELVHVPYKGTGPALNDLIGGQISALLVDMANAQNHVKSGKLRALAINGPKRSALLPDVPTFTELGFAGVEGTYARFGVLAPTGTPQAVIERISRDLTAVLTDPAIQDRFRPAGYDLYGSTPAQMGQMLRDDGERWGKVIAALGGLALD
jgi:tripartite-type tricarboxylate transporter receptor subunit TctC